MSHKMVLQSVVENGLDFLDKALEEFEAYPKYSVIHFHAAVEIFLKARLLAEHWSLVVSKKQDPDWKKFEQGDFASITFEEAATKLDKVIQSPLSPQEIKIFRNLGKHRNRMVHFYHRADTPDAAADELREIAKEQLSAWYLLNRLLTEQWVDVFEEWRPRLLEISIKLKKHHEFLQLIFDDLRPEIERRKTAGGVFGSCPSCGFESQEVEEDTGALKQGNCLVCQFECRFVTMECPCGHTVKLIGEGFGTCGECHHNFEPEDVKEAYAQRGVFAKDDLADSGPTHCSNCDGYDTVIEQDGDYFCTNCYETYECSDLEQCQWCGEYNAGGDMEDSGWKGCAACEGRGGWGNDD